MTYADADADADVDNCKLRDSYVRSQGGGGGGEETSTTLALLAEKKPTNQCIFRNRATPTYNTLRVSYGHVSLEEPRHMYVMALVLAVLFCWFQWLSCSWGGDARAQTIFEISCTPLIQHAMCRISWKTLKRFN